MVEAAPTTALVVSEADLLLEFLVIALDPSVRLGDGDQALERGAREPDVVGSASPARSHPASRSARPNSDGVSLTGAAE